MSVKYPIVPVAPGIPPVLRQQGALVSAAVLLLKDSVRALLGAPAVWGIFLAGKPVVVADSIVALDFKKEWHISDYPIARGDFSSYNKVRLPYDSRIVMTRGGTEAQRTEFLATIDKLAGSLESYDIVTPEATYTDANIARYDYRRTAVNGATLLSVSLHLQEIRNTANGSFSNVDLTAAPSGSSQINAGVTQPTAIPPSLPQSATVQSIDNLPGFSAPIIDYSSMGFQ